MLDERVSTHHKILEPCSNVSVQFVFMDSMDASGMMGMEQVRPGTQLNAMQQQTPHTMMQYNGQYQHIFITLNHWYVLTTRTP